MIVVTHSYNHSTQEAEAEQVKVQGQPQLQSKILSQNKKWVDTVEGVAQC